MPNYKFIVFTNPVAGREDEYNEWYTQQHLKDVLKVPGVVAAQRFRTTPSQRAPEPLPYKYVAIYELETDDVAGIMAEIGRRSGTDAMPMSTALAAERTSYIVEAITARETA